MAVSIHFFRLAKLNSEIKYVANSIVRDVPTYAYPAIRDMAVWQSDMLQQLDEWAAAIPQTQPRNEYIAMTCEVRCLAIKMLLLRPSPAIPTPTAAAMTSCHEAARQSLRLYEKLYRSDLIVYDWITLHGVVYSIITALYCIRVVPEIARGIHPEDIMEDLSVGISVLSATGEHWSGAKRARDILEDIGRLTVRWLRKTRQTNLQEQGIDHEVSGSHHEANTEGNAPMGQPAMQGQNDDNVPSNLDFLSTFELDLDLFSELQRRQEPFGDTVNIDDMMRNLFDDFIPSSRNPY
ncbi:hypothetical protein N0V87_009993 [Didymella glomerata]|jgi:hypothetical protein|uniref:Uncharacterized protein n=1 Tax=Didymella glomerata TaxID=749621 RepID=A0A9W8WQP0_9PLEO|nr:hypothetical protein N0V87_009993 [Didymella glomerata]